VNQKKMLNALTALRFFAAAMIVLTHGDPLFGSFGIANAAPLGQGVSFFFVLSGFILTYNYPSFATKEQFQNFFVARFARIWPLHAVTCLIWVYLIFRFDRQIYFPGAMNGLKLVTNLLMLHSWVPLKDWALSFNGVSWSISVEFFFYLCFPFIIILWRRYWHLLLGASAAIVVGILAISNHLHLPPEDSYPGVGLLGVVYFGPVVRVFEFMVGVGVANLLRKVEPIELSHSQWLALEAAAISAIVVAMVGVADVAGVRNIFGEAGAYYIQRDGIWLFWAILIGVFAMTEGPIGKFLSTRPMVFLGEVSFSLYLVHAVVITYLDPYAARVKAVGVIGLFEFWAVCLTLAALLFMGVERPCRGVILSWWAKKKFGAPTKRRRPFGALEISSLSVLVLAVVSMSMFRPTTIVAIDANSANAFLEQAVTSSDSSGEFSNGVKVMGIRIAKQPDGSTSAAVLMKSDRPTELTSIIAIHLNDTNGTIVDSLGDTPMDNGRSSVKSGTYWIQSFPLNPVELQKASTFGVVMYGDPPTSFLRVISTKTDWDSRRLIMKIKR
jgi:peptidoglycan/LPS O-acetylase OafA/YrhL